MSSTVQTNSWDGTAIMVRRGIVHHSVPVPGLTHLEATAGRPVKALAAYLSPTRPLIEAELDACLEVGCRSCWQAVESRG
jgi:hypothetical protein